MARIRSIKPEVWEDEEFELISDRAKLVWFNRITQADDSGRFLAAVPSIAASLGPRKPPSLKSIRTALRDLVDANLIVLYEVNGGQYGWFPNWNKHQKIDRRQPPKYPEPPPHEVGKAIRRSASRSSNGSASESSNESTTHSTGDRKGREGKGKDREGSVRGGGRAGASAREAGSTPAPDPDADARTRARARASLKGTP